MQTLVLNAGYEPLAVVSFRRALMLVLNNKASIIKIDPEHPIQTVTATFDRPSVIVLRRYVRVPYVRRIPVSRRGILRRDGNRCAYCAATATTIDHVVPRSRGGEDTWENLVACCFRCNNVKSDRLLRELGWKMTSSPRMPSGPAWFAMGIEHKQEAWMDFLSLAA